MFKTPIIAFSSHPMTPIPPFGYGAVEKIFYDRACLLAQRGYPTHIISKPIVRHRVRRRKFISRRNLLFHYCPLPEYMIYWAMHYAAARRGSDMYSKSNSIDLFWKYIAREVKKNKVNLLHTAYPSYAANLKKSLGDRVKIISEITTSIDEESTKRLIKLSADVDLILTVSDAIGKYAKPIVKKPVETLHNAVDTRLYRPDDNGKEKIIMCSGKFVHWKGQHVLLEALSKIDLRDWTVFFVGPAAEANYFDECVKKARLISKNIHFLGFVEEPDLVRLYGKAAICVFPSVGFEGFSLVVLEAMSSGCAVVASGIGGTPEAIEDRKTGFLVPPNDSSSIAESLSRLMKEDCIRQELGYTARESVLKRFTYDAHVDNLIHIYEKYDFA